MEYCTSCGAKLPANAVFCTSCGTQAPARSADEVETLSLPAFTAATGDPAVHRPRRTWLVVAAGAVALAGVAGVFLLTRGGSEDPVTATSAAAVSTPAAPSEQASLEAVPDASGDTSDVTLPVESTPMPQESGGASAASLPAFTVKTVSIDDLPAVRPFTYQTVEMTGVSPEVAARANALLAEVTDPNVEAWRATDPADCDVVDMDAPCGNWEQTATVVPCVSPYQCVLVEGSGITPGAATGSSFAASVVVDSGTGDSPSLAEALGGASVDHFLRLLNARVGAYQQSDWSMGCSDLSSVWNEPLKASDIANWLPTNDGLTVWFDKYQVGPGAAGNVTLTIPWSDLQDPSAGTAANPCATPQPSPGQAEDSGDSVTQAQADAAVRAMCAYGPEQLPKVVPGNADVDWTKVIQTVMYLYGFDPGPVDGKYGPVSQGAVKAFQRGSGIIVDAKVGPQTWAAMQGGVCGFSE